MYYQKLNPFSFLVETSRYLFARIIRSSYSQRFLDSFRAINGKLLKESGVSDLLLLQLPNLFAHATQFMAGVFSLVTGIGSKDNALDNSSILRTFMPNLLKLVAGIALAAATLLLGAVAATLVGLKTLLSAAIMIPSQIFVATTHMVTWPSRALAQDKIDQLSVTPTPRGPNGKLLKKAADLLYGTLNAKNQPDQADREQSFKQLIGQRYRKKTTEKINIKPLMIKNQLALGLYDDQDAKEKPVAIIKTTEANKDGISAFIRLNHFRTTENFESAGRLNELESRAGLRA